MSDLSGKLGWRGRMAVDAHGNTIGRIQEIYVASETDVPEWALVHSGLFDGRSSFMPLQGSRADGEKIVASFTKKQVRRAPRMRKDGRLSPEQGATLSAHYGIAEIEAREDNGLLGVRPQAREQLRGDASLGSLLAARLRLRRSRRETIDLTDSRAKP